MGCSYRFRDILCVQGGLVRSVIIVDFISPRMRCYVRDFVVRTIILSVRINGYSMHNSER